MKILICSLNFSPELTGIGKYSGEMAQWLCCRGHEIHVITAPPHNPQWKIGDGYSAWRFKKEYQVFSSRGELQVNRCPVWVPSAPRGWKRILYLLSFSLSTWPSMLKDVFWKPDIVLLIAPSLLCSPQVLCTAYLAGAVAWLHVQDFELDAAFELNDFSSSALRSAAEKFERIFIQSFDRGSSISRRMQERLIRKGLHSSRCVMFPNWVDTSLIYPIRGPVPLRRELGITDDKVVALYSGSMGKKQGLEFLLEVSRRMTPHTNIQFVFCGDGPARDLLTRATAQMPNVTLLSLQPMSRLNELLNMAEVHLLPQLAGAADLVMPSKLTGMMASGRAILATAEPGTQLDEVVSERGVVVRPSDVEGFVSALNLLARDVETRERLGGRAREYAIAQFEREHVLLKFEAAMIEACKSSLNLTHQLRTENLDN
jgi:colanic acid biosynthesis glycosyl transferase WcaI